MVFGRCLGAAVLVGLLAGLAGGAFLALAHGGVVEGAGWRLLFALNMAAVYAFAAGAAGLLPAAAAALAHRLARGARSKLERIAPAVVGALIAAALAARTHRALAEEGAGNLAALLAGLVVLAGLLAAPGLVRAAGRCLPATAAIAAVVLAGTALKWAPETDWRLSADAPREEASPAPPPSLPEGFARPRNVLLIVIDTLRADHLSCYGYPRRTSPVMDELARTGLLFEHAIIQRPKTSPSMASFLSGTYPHTHGVAAVRAWLPDEIVTLPERLAASGWRTAAFVTNPNLYRTFNFQQGLETHVEIGSHEGGNDAARVNAKVLPWIEENHAGPFFLWVHYVDPHAPYDPPPPYRDAFLGDALDGRHRDLEVAIGDDHVGAIDESVVIEDGSTDVDLYIRRYDEEILYVDAEIGKLLDRVRALGILEETLVVITSDHGESMAEHQVYFNHGLHPYENNIRVPLIVSYPPLIPQGRREPAVVESTDLMPTVLDLLGVERNAEIEGRSFLALLTGAGRWEREVAFAEAGPSDPDRFLTSVRRLPWKLIWNPNGLDLERDPYDPSVVLSVKKLRRLWLAAHGGPGSHRRWELYDIEADPDETRDLVRDRPEIVRELRGELAAWMATWPEKRETRRLEVEEIDPEVLEDLRGLGYIQ